MGSETAVCARAAHSMIRCGHARRAAQYHTICGPHAASEGLACAPNRLPPWGKTQPLAAGPHGTKFCDFAWGDLVYENVRFSFTEPPLNIENG